MEMMKEFSLDTTEEMISSEADRLGVELSALLCLGVAWAWKYDAFAFPMSDGFGNFIGIRLRSMTGEKWAVTGSRQGIFLPRNLPKCISEERTAYITEGPTDTAACLSMGLMAFGRPSCTGGNDQLKIALQRAKAREAVIISDCDAPGQKGSQKLSEELELPSCIFTPPAKDIRELYRFGGTKEFIQSTVKELIWNKPKQ